MMNTKTIAGIITTVIGAIIGIISAVIISGDLQPKGLLGTHYTYESPFTGHEIMMLVLLVASIIAVIVGIFLIIKGKKEG